VVGDSFVEALQVDSEQAFFKVLEQALNSNGLDAKVYSFGVSGFGTVEAYHLIKDYVLKYSPDLIIYLFIPNDVSDSSPFATMPRWTQPYDLSSDGMLIPLPFETYHLPTYRWVLKQSHLFRYIYYQLHLARIIRGRTSQVGGRAGESGLSTADEARAWRIIEALLQKLNRVLAEESIPWFLVWQGDIDPEFHLSTRRKLKRLATRHSLPYFDLSRDFAEDFTVHRRLVRIKGDGHWNKDGHRVAGTSLARLVLASLEEARIEETENYETVQD